MLFWITVFPYGCIWAVDPLEVPPLPALVLMDMAKLSTIFRSLRLATVLLVAPSVSSPMAGLRSSTALPIPFIASLTISLRHLPYHSGHVPLPGAGN